MASRRGPVSPCKVDLMPRASRSRSAEQLHSPPGLGSLHCPRSVMKRRWHFDVHKGLAGLAVLAMIAGHNQWENPTA